MTRRLPLIHIGMPKTATKTLQWRLFANHSEIFYLGRYDGGVFQGRYREFQACRDREVFELMDEIAYRNIYRADLPACRDKLAAYLADVAGEDQVPVWSWESYCTDKPEARQARARNLREVFGPARILVGIRHPVSLLESAYLQQLKRDNIGAGYRRGRAGYFTGIDDWYAEDRLRDISNHLDYPQTVQMYAEAFGEENVCVLPYELLLKDKEAFFARLCGFVDIDLQESLGLLEGKDDNSRWSSVQLQRLADIDASLFSRLRYRYATRAQRKAILGLNRRGSSIESAPKAAALLSPNNRQAIIERTREGNEWLARTFAIDLAEYGYFE